MTDIINKKANYNTYNSIPFNYQDDNNNYYNNYGGNKPSYQYKKNRIIHLNSAFASSTNVSGTTYYSLTFDIPSFQLFNQTKLKVIGYTSNESSAKIIVIKIDGLLFDANSTYNSDKDSYPTLFVSHTGVASQLNNNQMSLVLLPQQVSTITLYLSNTLSTRNAGFTISGGGAGNFILSLLFEDDDLIKDNAVSQYK